MYRSLHNLVLGFHGCSQETYENVLNNHQELKSSNNDYDWLGNGIYFWENSYERALEWANRFKPDHPAVIGAVIDLGYCLNLTDYGCTDSLKIAYELLKHECEILSTPLPRNTGKNADKPFRRLDCAVIERLHKLNSSINIKLEYDSVRGVFFEGNPIYPESGILDKTHIQLCIRNPNCIKGYFSPKEYNSGFKRI